MFYKAETVKNVFSTVTRNVSEMVDRNGFEKEHIATQVGEMTLLQWHRKLAWKDEIIELQYLTEITDVIL